MLMTWSQTQQYLNQEDTFAENDGEFQSYVVKDNIVLFINVDNSGSWSHVNYVQWIPQEGDDDECIVLQLDDAPDNPANYKIECELDIKVYVDITDEFDYTH